MANSLFISGIFLVVLVTPGFCLTTTVCKEENGDITVDCHVELKSNQINSYEFSISQDGKETIVNTNVTGVKAEPKFKEKAEVSLLDSAKGYRLKLKDEIKANTTFICKASNEVANTFIEKGKMLPCSAISAFLHSCPWLLSLLAFLHVSQSWVWSAL